MNANAKPILVVGGGIAGMTAAVEAAEAGYRVMIVEKEPYLGGRVLRMHRYFPKLCPPSCGYEINARRIRLNPRISIHTLSLVEQIQGHAGNFTATIKKRPRYHTGRRALDDNLADKLTTERVDDFNYGLGKTKALFKAHDMAYPPTWVLDRGALSDEDVALLSAEAPPDSLDLNMAEEQIRVEAGAIIVTTGWRPYDAGKIENLGFGRCDNVITNVMMERLAAMSGPTSGELLRPSDGKPVRNVAFVQCAGSRDENHLPYCSAVCCMGSLKQARYVREKEPDARVTIFYIDIRSVGRLEKFYYDLLEDPGISFIKGKVAKIEQTEGSKDLALDVEDTLAGQNRHDSFDLVVLATGMVPSTVEQQFPFNLKFDGYGFINCAEQRAAMDGIYAAGCAKHPCDVSSAARDATGAALKAIQCLSRGI